MKGLRGRLQSCAREKKIRVTDGSMRLSRFSKATGLRAKHNEKKNKLAHQPIRRGIKKVTWKHERSPYSPFSIVLILWIKTN